MVHSCLPGLRIGHGLGSGLALGISLVLIFLIISLPLLPSLDLSRSLFDVAVVGLLFQALYSALYYCIL